MLWSSSSSLSDIKRKRGAKRNTNKKLLYVAIIIIIIIIPSSWIRKKTQIIIIIIIINMCTNKKHTDTSIFGIHWTKRKIFIHLISFREKIYFNYLTEEKKKNSRCGFIPPNEWMNNSFILSDSIYLYMSMKTWCLILSLSMLLFFFSTLECDFTLKYNKWRFDHNSAVDDKKKPHRQPTLVVDIYIQIKHRYRNNNNSSGQFCGLVSYLTIFIELFSFWKHNLQYWYSWNVILNLKNNNNIDNDNINNNENQLVTLQLDIVFWDNVRQDNKSETICFIVFFVFLFKFLTFKWISIHVESNQLKSTSFMIDLLYSNRMKEWIKLW